VYNQLITHIVLKFTNSDTEDSQVPTRCIYLTHFSRKTDLPIILKQNQVLVLYNSLPLIRHHKSKDKTKHFALICIVVLIIIKIYRDSNIS